MAFLISRTPYRVSFFGGGTDYPSWYLENGGAVISTSINKYCYITCRYLPPFFNIRHRIVWSHIEMVSSISEILHPAVRMGLVTLGFDDSRGIELHHQGDLPARSGIGSSSAFAVGLINVLTTLRDEKLDKHRLAMAAIDLEQRQLKQTVGSQDQVACAYGGLNVIRFNMDGSIGVDPVALPDKRRADLEQRLMMFYTGTSRLSIDFTSSLVANFSARKAHLQEMQKMVFQALDILLKGDLDDFGRLLNDNWRLKRELTSSISSKTIDDIYETAMKAGALGGKLLGAGGAGFMVFYVPLEQQNAVRAALKNFLYVPIEVDLNGSSLIYRGSD